MSEHVEENVRPEPPLAMAPRRGRVSRYGLWQLRDYATDRGFPTLLISSLLGYLTVGPMKSAYDRNIASLPPTLIDKWGGPDAARAVMQHEFNELFLRNVLGSLVFLGALLAMNGIVANDRKLGFYRFLFAKPVRPLHYYGQAFLLHAAGYAAIVTTLFLLYGALLWPILTASLIQAIMSMFIMYAGITFMLSAIARWDWLSLVSFTVLGSYLWDKFGASVSPVAKLIYLFPPLSRTSEVYLAVSKSEPLPWELLGWFGGYGVICFFIGLIVLRFRRLAIV